MTTCSHEGKRYHFHKGESPDSVSIRASRRYEGHECPGTQGNGANGGSRILKPFGAAV